MPSRAEADRVAHVDRAGGPRQQRPSLLLHRPGLKGFRRIFPPPSVSLFSADFYSPVPFSSFRVLNQIQLCQSCFFVSFWQPLSLCHNDRGVNFGYHSATLILLAHFHFGWTICNLKFWSWSLSQYQSWALEVASNFYIMKNSIIAFSIKWIWLGVGCFNRPGSEVGCFHNEVDL